MPARGSRRGLGATPRGEGVADEPDTLPPATSPVEDEIDLARLVARLWANKRVIAAFTGLALFIGLLFFFGTAPTYRADALLQLEEKKGQFALPEGLSDLTGAGRAARHRDRDPALAAGAGAGGGRRPYRLDGKPETAAFFPPQPLFALAFRCPRAWPEGFLRGDERLRTILEVPPSGSARIRPLRLGEAGTFTVTLPDGQAAGASGVPLTLPEGAVRPAHRRGRGRSRAAVHPAPRLRVGCRRKSAPAAVGPRTWPPDR